MGIGIGLFEVTSDSDEVAMVSSDREDTCAIGTRERTDGGRCDLERVIPLLFRWRGDAIAEARRIMTV
jgi:hypothetical protein